MEAHAFTSPATRIAAAPSTVLDDRPVLKVCRLAKSFVVHAQDGLRLPVLDGVSLAVSPGECLALVGPSGAGKSTLLRSLYGNYRADSGSIRIRRGNEWVELVGAEPRIVLDLRRDTIGFVSQFLRVIPRVATIDVVAEPMRRLGAPAAESRDKAEFLLALLNIPPRLWSLPPATFSGGEQQRVNIVRSLVVDYPVLLLDEPTASLDADNRARVLELLARRRDAGAALVGIFHDVEVRDQLANRVHDVVPGVAA